mgnify:CR=1 FL=1
MQRTACPPACDSSPSTRRLPRMLQQSLAWLTRQLQPPGSLASHVRTRSIALLIDGENTSPEMIMPILTEAGKFGMITIRRVYGKASALQSWQDTLIRYALRPIYQPPTSSTKNATDIALVIDAMDLMHTAQVDGFCLVASDSDYTPLVTRLRETGCLVVGMGKANTPTALVRACTFFVIMENPAIPVSANQSTSPARNGSQLPQPAASAATRVSTRRSALPATNGSPPATRAAPPASYQAALPDPAPLFLAVYDALLAAHGQVDFSTFVSECKKRYPDLVPTHYGYSRLASLIKSRIDLFRFEPGLLSGQKVVHRVVAPSAVAESARPVEAPSAVAESARPVEAPSAVAESARPVETPSTTAYRARRLLLAAWDRAPRQDGWLFASVLGAHLKQLDPNFDPKTYGYARLGLLIQAHSDLFEIRERAKGSYDVRLLSASG